MHLNQLESTNHQGQSREKEPENDPHNTLLAKDAHEESFARDFPRFLPDFSRFAIFQIRLTVALTFEVQSNFD